MQKTHRPELKSMNSLGQRYPDFIKNYHASNRDACTAKRVKHQAVTTNDLRLRCKFLSDCAKAMKQDAENRKFHHQQSSNLCKSFKEKTNLKLEAERANCPMQIGDFAASPGHDQDQLLTKTPDDAANPSGI